MTQLPLLLFGPVIRRAQAQFVRIQLATSRAIEPEFTLDGYVIEQSVTCSRLGESLFLYSCTIMPKQGEFKCDESISYSLNDAQQHIDLSSMCYQGEQTPSLLIPKALSDVLHGSCRNPHHYSDDTLVRADSYMQEALQDKHARPQLLIMSGDQIYADDVAGPTLMAIERLIETLGIYKQADGLPHEMPSQALDQLYRRDLFLPKKPWHKQSKLSLAYWLKKDEPHFSSVKSANHLIAFEELVALYLLCYSKACWQLAGLDSLQLDEQHPKKAVFEQEKQHLLAFAEGLDKVTRLMAHISTVMIFDDHDVTDDWNLCADWESNVYTHPRSRSIISNALVAYALFQGWGNTSLQQSWPFFDQLDEALSAPLWQLEQVRETALGYQHWHFQLPTTPQVVVLDTRTHRWRNEQDFHDPSGLLDWEQLLELEGKLEGLDHAIVVSPAPVFGVKSIEAIQAVFAMCNKPLVVDCENWMAHEGSAKKLLDIFRRLETPQETIILSGDVHYSFCFSVTARFSDKDNRIWQLTASGIKNEFPRKAINVLDKLDSLLYAPYSPLNLFTKRWQMKVDKHDTSSGPQQHLVSKGAISLVNLHNGELTSYKLLHADNTYTEFDLN